MKIQFAIINSSIPALFNPNLITLLLECLLQRFQSVHPHHRFLWVQLLHVHHINPPMDECLGADMALVRRFTGMRPQVDIKHIPPIERLPTVRTNVVPPLVVNVHVTIQSVPRKRHSDLY